MRADLTQGGLHEAEVLGVGQLEDLLPEPIVLAVAEHALHGRALVGDGAIGRDDQEDVRGVGHQRAEPLFADAEVLEQRQLTIRGLSGDAGDAPTLAEQHGLAHHAEQEDHCQQAVCGETDALVVGRGQELVGDDQRRRDGDGGERQPAADPGRHLSEPERWVELGRPGRPPEPGDQDAAALDDGVRRPGG